MQFSSQRVEELQGDSETWNAVGTTNDYSVTFQNSWANTGGGNPPAGFYKDKFNRVYLRGDIDTGSTSTVAFTLPVGYRPEYPTIQLVNNDNGGPGPGGASVRVSVGINGDVTPIFTAGTNIWLDGVNFRAT